MAPKKTMGATGKLSESLLKDILSAYAYAKKDLPQELLEFLAVTSEPTLTVSIVKQMYHAAVEEADGDLPSSSVIMG